jgi:hypothetical protein
MSIDGVVRPRPGAPSAANRSILAIAAGTCAQILCAVTLTACPRQETTIALQSQAAWRSAVRAEPVLPAGHDREQGLWNDPSVLKMGDQYVMYMASSIEQPFQPPIVPFRAVSPNGIDWTLSPKEPLLLAKGTPFANIETPSVVMFGGKYHMYYTGVFPKGAVPAMAIGHAVSTDGISWKDDRRAVIAATGKVSDWNGYLVAEPGAVVYRGKIYLYFTAMGSRPGGKPPQLETIGLVTTSDGETFDEPRIVLRQSESYPATKGFVGYSTPCAVVLDGKVHLFHDVVAFFDSGNPQWQQIALQHAVSDDGETGFRQDAKPLLVREDLHWTSGEILGPSALVDDGRLKLWFSGHVTYRELVPFVARGYMGNEFGIGYAEVDLNAFKSAAE